MKAAMAAFAVLALGCSKDKQPEKQSEPTPSAAAARPEPEQQSSPLYPDPAGPLGACVPEEAKPVPGCPFDNTGAAAQGPMPDWSIFFEKDRSFGREAEPECYAVGALAVPGGTIVAGDPGTLSGGEPFSQRVPKGNHPAWVLLARLGPTHVRVAAVMVRFTDTRPVKWTLAVTRTTPKDASDTVWWGYGVDSGTGSFLSPEALAVMEKKIGGGEWLFGDDFRGWDAWANRCVDRKHKLNVIAVHSGWGDGVYSSFWGRDEAGELAALVTWFDVFEFDADPRE